jgi:hypothetical protein
MPCIDGARLSDLVAKYETGARYQPAGGYGPLFPEQFRCGPIEDDFFGRMREYRENIYVLGCECGEVGCWPLCCRVELTVEVVAWKHLEQPHRPDRDYSSFGPFAFLRDRYEHAVSKLAGGLWSA